jgi:hypothetical protein
MDLESKYCYIYHSWDFVPYQLSYFICIKDFNAETITSLKLNLFFFLYLRLSASSKENDLPLDVKPLIQQMELRTYTKVVPFQEKSSFHFVALWQLLNGVD